MQPPFASPDLGPLPVLSTSRPTASDDSAPHIVSEVSEISSDVTALNNAAVSAPAPSGAARAKSTSGASAAAAVDARKRRAAEGSLLSLGVADLALGVPPSAASPASGAANTDLPAASGNSIRSRNAEDPNDRTIHAQDAGGPAVTDSGSGAVQPGERSGLLAFGANVTSKFAPPAAGSRRATPSSGSGFPPQQDEDDLDAQPARAGKTASPESPPEQDSNPPDPTSPQAIFGTFASLAPGVAPRSDNETGPGRSPDTAAQVPVEDPPPILPSAVSAPPQEMLLRVAPPSSATGASVGNVDIRVTQRSGDLLVTVHTPDPALQANLRQDLPELVNALDHAGFEAQTFVPRAVAAAATASGFSSEQGAGGNPADTSNSGGTNSHSGNPQDASSFSGPFSGQSSERQHSSRDRQAQRWLDQIEE